MFETIKVPDSVLIETYWNVKKGEKGEQGVQGPVLIETYWNVKRYALYASLFGTGY